jgi:hypothetical protein
MLHVQNATIHLGCLSAGATVMTAVAGDPSAHYMEIRGVQSRRGLVQGQL